MVAKWLKNVIYTLTILKLWFQIKKKTTFNMVKYLLRIKSVHDLLAAI